MTIDYKLLADNDPGGDLQTAYESMTAETVTSTPEVMVTYRRISASVSLAASADLEAAVLAATTMPSWVNTALASDGIDVNDHQVGALLESLVPTHKTNIEGMGVITVPKYPNLKVGHLQDARAKRALGEV